jgi:outer membrane protein insertion porin family
LIFVGTWLVTLALIATPLTAQVPSASDAGPPLIKDIVMEGIRRVPPWVILSRIQTRIGDEFSLSGVRDDVRAVFALGFFDDVQVRREELEGGVRVIFVMVERPLVREVHFEGNRDVTTDELREHAAVRVGELYNPVAVQLSVDAISRRYEAEGFYGFTISPQTEPTPAGDVRVIFQINEGQQLRP